MTEQVFKFLIILAGILSLSLRASTAIVNQHDETKFQETMQIVFQITSLKMKEDLSEKEQKQLTKLNKTLKNRLTAEKSKL